MTERPPDKKEVEQKEKHLRESIAKNYSHIKNVEAQLAQLQLQLNLTSGPKKSALEMIRRKIECKNEQVVAARQKFLSAQKVAEQAEEVLRSHERSKEQLCQELHLLVHQSATAELNKLEQLTAQLDQLNGGNSKPASGAKVAALEQALALHVASTSNTPSAEDAAAATTEQQALAAADASSHLQSSSNQAEASAGRTAMGAAAESEPSKPPAVRAASAEQHARQTKAAAAQPKQHSQQTGRKKSNQNRKQLERGLNEAIAPQMASDSAGRFTGFES